MKMYIGIVALQVNSKITNKYYHVIEAGYSFSQKYKCDKINNTKINQKQDCK